MKTAGKSPPFCFSTITRTVIASEAKQSSLRLRRDGLLRCARNDVDRAAPYFFFAPTRLMLLIASGVRPDFSAISRSCSMM